MAIRKRRGGARKKNAGSSRKLAFKKETIMDLTPRGSAAMGGTIYVVRSLVSSLPGSSLSSASLSSYSGYSVTLSGN